MNGTYYDVQLCKDGRLFALEWSSGESDYVESEITNGDLISYMDDFICFEDNLTLKDLFLFIFDNVDLCSLISACPFVPSLVEEVFNVAKTEEDDGEEFKNIVGLKLKRIRVIEKEEINGPFVYEFFNFVGYDSNNEIYSLEFTPLYKIAHLPLKLSENVLDFNGNSFKQKFNLSEVIKNVIGELAFVSPIHREEALSLLNEKYEDEESINEMMTKEARSELGLSEKKCSICGKEARSPHFKKPKNICISCFINQKIN